MKYLPALFALLSCSIESDVLSDGCTVNISDTSFQGKAVYHKLTTTQGFKLLLYDNNGIVLDQAIFKYPGYQLHASDVNRDGQTDILIGLLKSTRFDPGENKRLFILRIDEGHLRPLWLGSKVCQELVDFKANEKGVVKTIEKTNRGNYAIGLYEWQGFGLTLIEYSDNEISHNEAYEKFVY